MPLIIALFANLEEVIAIYRLPKTSIPYTNEAGIPITFIKLRFCAFLSLFIFIIFYSLSLWGKQGVNHAI